MSVRKSTRREFVRAVSAWSAIVPAMPLRLPQGTASAKRVLGYVGTYSSRDGANHGQGIRSAGHAGAR